MMPITAQIKVIIIWYKIVLAKKQYAEKYRGSSTFK